MYMFVVCCCFGCGVQMTCNPDEVPSIRPEPGADREPLCRACAERFNQRVVEAGGEAVPIHPDAYEAEEV